MTEVSEKANTVDEYRAEIREKLEKRAEDNADRAFEDAVLDAVSDNAEVDIPKAMIDDEVTAMLRDMEMRLAYQGNEARRLCEVHRPDGRPASRAVPPGRRGARAQEPRA